MSKRGTEQPGLRTAICALGLMVSGLGACGLEGGPTEPQEPTLAQSAAPIINGTFEPTLVSLTASQQLAIGFLSHGTASPFCTATLITNDVVITAEHCVKDQDLSTIQFGLGSGSAPRARFNIRRATLGGWERDTAILQLTQNVVANVPEVTPLRLQRTPLPASLVNGSAEACGYHLIGSEEARRRFGVLGITNLLEGAIVANGFGARGVCHGDSGGPLMAELSPGRTTLIGITLGGNESCRDESYFTRIDAILDWLDPALAALSQSPSPTADGRAVPRPSCAKGDPNSFWPALGAIVLVRRRRAGGSRRRPAKRS